MKDRDNSAPSFSRREFLRLAGAGATALGLGTTDSMSTFASAAPAASPTAQNGLQHAGPYNILFILTDQERFFRPGELPIGYSLPAHERLIKKGTTFTNHRMRRALSPRRSRRGARRGPAPRRWGP